VALADDATVERALATLDGWSRDGGALVRQLEFPGFREAIDFIVRVADLAEAAETRRRPWRSGSTARWHW
jgi:4a-hydroxytetrahydrobiopterin dehydratase